MSWQHMDPREANHAEGSFNETVYSDNTPLHGQKIYPPSASPSVFPLVLAIISWMLWLAALFIILMVVLIARVSIVSTNINTAQPPVVGHPSDGVYVFFIFAAFLLFSVLLILINLFVRKKNKKRVFLR
jgi:hypothetical protein